MRPRRTARHGGTASVSIHVRDLAQMFNSLDPSPFWDRDLDREAAEFIEDEFSEKRAADQWHLHIHAHEGAASATDIQAAIEHYYERLANSVRLGLREQARIGELALLVGVAVFSICISLRGLLETALHGLPRGLDEGLIVLGWIALWRPIEVLAYGWVPLYRKRRLYQRLARIRVSVRCEPAMAPATPATTLNSPPAPAAEPETRRP
ncbi:MAG: hypothetical protein WA446_15430 [Steroidobacteraceae bacterium]